MKKLVILAALGGATLATAASAHDTTTPHATRGECEVALAQINNEDRDWLAATFPQLFGSRGEAQRYLEMNFKCEQSAVDGQWYIVDHRNG